MSSNRSYNNMGLSGDKKKGRVKSSSNHEKVHDTSIKDSYMLLDHIEQEITDAIKSFRNDPQKVEKGETAFGLKEQEEKEKEKEKEKLPIKARNKKKPLSKKKDDLNLQIDHLKSKLKCYEAENLKLSTTLNSKKFKIKKLKESIKKQISHENSLKAKFNNLKEEFEVFKKNHFKQKSVEVLNMENQLKTVAKENEQKGHIMKDLEERYINIVSNIEKLRNKTLKHESEISQIKRKITSIVIKIKPELIQDSPSIENLLKIIDLEIEKAKNTRLNLNYDSQIIATESKTTENDQHSEEISPGNYSFEIQTKLEQLKNKLGKAENPDSNSIEKSSNNHINEKIEKNEKNENTKAIKSKKKKMAININTHSKNKIYLVKNKSSKKNG